jgi:hypothetical protein
MTGRPIKAANARKSGEIVYIVVALFGAIVTTAYALRHTSSPLAFGIGLLCFVFYWRLVRGATIVYLGFGHRIGRLRNRNLQGRVSAYDGLRAKALSVSAKDLQLDLSAAQAVPFGVLMETGHPKAVVTLTSFLTGDASLYFSTGGGVIGGVGHEKVRDPARAFVTASVPYVPKMQPALEFPAPSTGMTRWYVLTTRGIVTAEFSEVDLGNGRSEFSPLFHAGQQVITQLRLVSSK